MLSSLPVGLAEVQAARREMADFVRATPLYHSPSISHLLGAQVHLKAENLQRAGSFKIRGAFHKLSSLPPERRALGVIAASAGNHAQGVALAAQRMGIAATIVMPEGAPVTKVAATEGYGAKVVLAGATYDDAHLHAQHLRDQTGATFIPGFDDPRIIAGQGTIGLEIADDLPDVGTVVVPVGGGGLIAGIAVALKSMKPDLRVVGVQARGAPAVYLAKRDGRYTTTDSVRTIADGIAIKRPGELPWRFIDQLVDDVLLVDEEEIGHAILVLLEQAKLVVEGAGAVGLAAMLAGKLPRPREPVVIVLSGGNIDVNILGRIIERGLVRAGRFVRLTTFVPDRPGGLAQLLQIVASAGGNVIHVQHERWLDKVTVGEVEIDLALETRNQSHAGELLDRLRREGYEVRLTPPDRPADPPGP